MMLRLYLMQWTRWQKARDKQCAEHNIFNILWWDILNA